MEPSFSSFYRPKETASQASSFVSNRVFYCVVRIPRDAAQRNAFAIASIVTRTRDVKARPPGRMI